MLLSFKQVGPAGLPLEPVGVAAFNPEPGKQHTENFSVNRSAILVIILFQIVTCPCILDCFASVKLVIYVLQWRDLISNGEDGVFQLQASSNPSCFPVFDLGGKTVI